MISANRSGVTWRRANEARHTKVEKQRIIGALDHLPAHSAVTFCGDLRVHYLNSQVHAPAHYQLVSAQWVYSTLIRSLCLIFPLSTWCHITFRTFSRATPLAICSIYRPPPVGTV